MTHRRYSKAFRRSALSAALGLCFASGAYAQSNSAGAVFGQAASGDTILLENPSTGFSRQITVGADGIYRISAVPTGQYQITVRHPDGSTAVRQNVAVNVGTGTSVNFTQEAGGTTTLGGITVVGSRLINPVDVSSVESTTVLTAERIAQIPVPRDISSVALLAPGTVKGDAAFGNLASFGGSSVAENQYYVNGFNVTNTFKNLNFAQIPFEGIAQQQIKTGGYGAEFGRSTGGVVNLITKRGTNEFHAGGNVFWTPEGLSETNPNRYDNSGTLLRDSSRNIGSSSTAAVWASGALIKDRLYAYGLLQYGRSQSDYYPGVLEGAGANNSNSSKSPTWLLKLDWNINDSNLLEFTGFSDTRKTESDYYSTTYSSSGSPSRGNYRGTAYTRQGGNGYALKYTGYFSDNFTLSALAGHGSFERNNYAIAANGIVERYNGNLFGDVAGCPQIQDLRPLSVRQATGTIVGCNFAGRLGRPDNRDTRNQFRIDADWQLGSHLVRFGYDVDNFTTQDGSAYEGGYFYRYLQFRGQDYVRRYNIRQAATVEVNQKAFYVEDSWNVTDKFMLYGGLRWDSFANLNGNGATYVEINNQLGPRLGFSWDVKGDSSTKIFGNAGRYALPLTANVAIRGASASVYQIQDFLYTGRDPQTQAPLGLTPRPGSFFENPYYANGETGGPKDPRTIAATNLEPMYQDEYILGVQHQFADNFAAGIRVTHRDLKRAIDDTCDIRPFYDYAAANNMDVVINPAFTYCHLYNPGTDPVFTVDINGDGTLETVKIDSNVLGPKAIRRYNAAEFFFEGTWDKFFLQGSYTWSKSYGNTEGGVKSDIGQSDTGTTQDFDYPELAIGSYGDLPNDRRHSVKLFGNYKFNDEWSFGFNALMQSGRPENCMGIYGSDPTGYGVSYFSCDAGEPPAGSNNNGTTIVPRGTVGRTPWIYNFDINVAYKPAFADGKLQFKADVFNLFNNHHATAVDEDGETTTGSRADALPTYLTPVSWQSPRSVRFMVQYDF